MPFVDSASGIYYWFSASFILLFRAAHTCINQNNSHSIRQLIESGTLNAHEKLPSLRDQVQRSGLV